MVTIFGIRKFIEKNRSSRNEDIWVCEKARLKKHPPKDVSDSFNFVNFGRKPNSGSDLQLSTQSLMGFHGPDMNSNICNGKSNPNLMTGIFSI